jgi:hypothetical protein
VSSVSSALSAMFELSAHPSREIRSCFRTSVGEDLASTVDSRETSGDSIGKTRGMLDGNAMKAERTIDRVDTDLKRSSNSITPVIAEQLVGEDSFIDTTTAGLIVASQIPKFSGRPRNCRDQGDKSFDAREFEQPSALRPGPGRPGGPGTPSRKMGRRQSSGCLLLSRPIMITRRPDPAPRPNSLIPERCPSRMRPDSIEVIGQRAGSLQERYHQ